MTLASRRRPLLPTRAGPRAGADLAVRRPAQRRDRAPARRLRPLAARRRESGDRRRSRDAVCLLDVPVHKTGHRVHQAGRPGRRRGHRGLGGGPAGAAADARPQDRRGGGPAVRLPRHRQSASTYINTTLIPLLCRKAGVPPRDVRGRITSHRARATIASQLYNAKEPMTLFELQAWLGHRSPETTQHYAQITPTHADQGLHRRRLLRPQRAHDRGARSIARRS